ncbi:ATP-binding protein [Butyrivibrio sp. CB08]|uniref:histidine kinase N-terminal 7TM domain-containing protein n=1 Tax=Butyrivibrio sp. CB08 TaxID=2364879 RepID=UPI000EAA579D|nr:histidine kinase N-terminal 7TM domain-containing protein [Butyrivibrio sp. CB08]RKM61260.1 ATP-binding protein [Butyrivibrio sp. CB08]
MHDFLLAILVLSILGLFTESFIVFRNMKSRLHAYLFMNCFVMIINNIGYLAQLLSKTKGEYMASLKFSYAGRVWILFSLFMFTVELCHIRIPQVIVRIFVLIDIVTYGIIFTMPNHNLYYTKTIFNTNGMFPILLHQSGIVHAFFMQYQIIAIAFILFWMFKSLRKHTSGTAKKRIWIIVAGYLVETALYLVQVSHIFPVTYTFDVSVFGNVAVTVAMFIAIFRYNLLGIIDLAREYIIDTLAEGVIAVDSEGQIQYYNQHAKVLYPDIVKDPESVVTEIQEAIIKGDTITFQDRYYTPEEKELFDDGESFGKLYALVDTTVLKQREYKLKADAAIIEMAANNMKERLLTTEELMNQDRTMRHDRRHFEALLLSLIQDGKVEEARECLQERLSQEPRSAKRYCENATVNAALMHYVTMAERKGIKTSVATNIPYEPGVDEMQLAIAVSNLFENAIHACEEVPESERFIELTAKFKDQLLLEIVNSCIGQVELDEDGHPITNEQGHGIGTKSVIAFAEKTGSEIRYIAEDGRFKVRMIIG